MVFTGVYYFVCFDSDRSSRNYGMVSLYLDFNVINGVGKMGKASKKAVKAALEYRDEVRHVYNTLQGVQSRYLESGGSLTKPTNTFYRWLNYYNDLEELEYSNTTGDEKYDLVLESVDKWEGKISSLLPIMKKELGIDEPEPDKKQEEPEPIPLVMSKSEYLLEKDVALKARNLMIGQGCTASLLPPQAHEAYLEDMFVFQGAQIQALQGTAKIVELFTKIICEGRA